MGKKIIVAMQKKCLLIYIRTRNQNQILNYENQITIAISQKEDKKESSRDVRETYRPTYTRRYAMVQDC